MNQEQQSKCLHCGAGMKAFWHQLSPGLVGVLIKAIQFVRTQNNNDFSIHDLSLSNTEYNNFQKLRFHALITKIDGKKGHWLITARGGQFLRGEIQIPKGVQTFRNKVLGHSDDLIHIRDLKNKFPSFESEHAYEYQKSDIIQPQLSFK